MLVAGPQPAVLAAVERGGVTCTMHPLRPSHILAARKTAGTGIANIRRAREPLRGDLLCVPVTRRLTRTSYVAAATAFLNRRGVRQAVRRRPPAVQDPAWRPAT